MATHSSILAWRIPGTEESGGLPSMGLHRVGLDRSNLATVVAYIYSLFFRVKFPVLYNRSLFVIHFIYSSVYIADEHACTCNVYMSIPISQFIPLHCFTA